MTSQVMRVADQHATRDEPRSTEASLQARNPWRSGANNWLSRAASALSNQSYR